MGGRGGRRRATQADVARVAGVSAPLVSAVISGSTKTSRMGASQETVQRIWDAARTLGYVPNVVARNLAGGRTRLISVFSYASVFPHSADDFYHQFLVGIADEADAQGYSLVLSTSSRDVNGDRMIYVDGANSLQIADGAIILGRTRNTTELAELTHDGFPFVHVSRRDVPGAEISYVAEDYYTATRRAVSVLHGWGHRRIGYLTNGYATEQVAERSQGFRDEAAALGMDDNEAVILQVPSRGTLKLAQDRELTAVIMETPDEAVHLRSACRRKGIGVPGELSIVSLGGWISRARSPQVAGFVIPQQTMGRRAVQMLIKLVTEPGSGPLQERVQLDEHLEHTIGPPPS